MMFPLDIERTSSKKCDRKYTTKKMGKKGQEVCTAFPLLKIQRKSAPPCQKYSSSAATNYRPKEYTSPSNTLPLMITVPRNKK